MPRATAAAPATRRAFTRPPLEAQPAPTLTFSQARANAAECSVRQTRPRRAESVGLRRRPPGLMGSIPRAAPREPIARDKRMPLSAAAGGGLSFYAQKRAARARIYDVRGRD